MAIEKIKRRLAAEQGFTLIELLIVILILGSLTLIAVPSYLTYRDRARQVATQSNVSSAVPGAETYYQVTGSYANVKRSSLLAQSPGIDPNIKAVALNGGAGYCVEDSSGVYSYDYIGGNATPLGTWKLGTIQAATCLTAAGAVALST